MYLDKNFFTVRNKVGFRRLYGSEPNVIDLLLRMKSSHVKRTHGSERVL